MCDTGHIWPHYGCHPDNRDSRVGSGATGGSSITDRIHHPTLVTGNLRTAASCCSAACCIVQREKSSFQILYNLRWLVRMNVLLSVGQVMR